MCGDTCDKPNLKISESVRFKSAENLIHLTCMTLVCQSVSTTGYRHYSVNSCQLVREGDCEGQA
jgi:hypothetical protein